MSVAVTRTKILVPKRRPDLLSRSRLISLFDDVLDYPYTLISAPAGYGKTSLMIDLAHQANYPVCWYSIDPLDLDPNRFLTHFIHSIRTQFPEFGDTALSLLENQANPFHDPVQVTSVLINEIYQTISEHFVIFLDDYHHLNSDQGISSFISRFGQEMDDNTHLIMASRTLFNFPDLTLLIGRRMVKGISFDDLAFQAREIRSYYQEILQRDITDIETETLFDRTEGWITGLVFSIDTDLAHLPGSGKKGRITGADLFQYLADQVLEKQPLPIQDFLLRSSLLDEFNADFCDKVLGAPDSGSYAEMISQLQQKNLFIQQVEDESSWIRFHTLFRDFLRTRFHDLYPAEENKILVKLLEIYQGSESWEKAFEAARQTGNSKLMAEVIDQANSDLIHQGRMKLLCTWLEMLPEDGFEVIPKLYLLRGISFTSLGNPKKGLSYINQIIDHPKIAKNPNLLIRAILCRITTSRMLGHYAEVMADIKYIFKEHKSENISDNLLAEAYREAALGYLNIDNFSKSKENFILSINIYNDLGDIINQALVHQDLGLLLMEYGMFHESAQHFKIAKEIWTNSNNSSKLSNIYNNIGTLLYLTGKYKESANFLQSAISYSQESLDSRMLAFAVTSQGDLARSISLYEKSLITYKQANIIAEKIQESYLLSYLAINQAIIFRYKGKLKKAEEFLQITQTFFTHGASHNDIGKWHLEMGFHQLSLEEYPSSRESFLIAAGIFEDTGKTIELAKAQMGLVLVNHEMSKSRSVQKHIKEWIASLIPLETYQPLLPELHFQEGKIRAVLKRRAHSPALDSLLADLESYRAELPRLQKEIFPGQSHGPLPADNLAIIALGKNQIFSSGNKITSPEWIYQKTVRELLYFLLTLPRGATKEQIGLVFWPDSSPSQLTCQFKNAIYRLRRSIGRDAILYDPETRTYSFNKDQPYTYDVEDFLCLIKKAEQESRTPDKIACYRKAVDIYNHPYSPMLDGVWAEPVRQNLSRKYEQALLIIAEHELDQKRYQFCLKCCQKILDIDPCQEKAFHLSFYAYAKTNDRTGLVRSYANYRDNLLNFHNIKPSKATRILYKNLLEE